MRLSLFSSCLVLLSSLGCAEGGADPASRQWPDPGELDGAVLYAQQCAACHGEVGEGGLGPTLIDWPRGRDALFTAIADTMPQGNPANCDETCAVAIGRYVLEYLTSDALGCDDDPTSARRVRLLTRREYRNTVFDLFGDLAPPASSPGTCAEHTFSYDPGGRSLSSVHVSGDFNGWSPDAWPLSFDAARGRWELSRAVPSGTYQYKFVLDGAEWVRDTSNPATAPDGFGGDNSVLTVECGAAGTTALPDPAGNFPVETRPQGFPFDTDSDSGLVTAVHVDEQLRAADAIVLALGDSVSALAPCASGQSESDCGREFVTSFGRRAFRRPLTTAESDRYQALVASQLGISDGVALAVRAMLVSPSFLYRTEVGEAVGDGTYRLTPYEVASALSYGLWATTPDNALLDAAESGELTTVEGIEIHARRLLDDPRARAPLRTFALQWLGVESVRTAPKIDAAFSTDVRQSLEREAALLVEHIVFDGTGRFDELFTADYTFVDETLSGFYGFGDLTGSELRRIPTPEHRAAGVLGLGAVLANYAHSDQSSPIQRGLFVRQTLLCQDFAQPPANAGGVPDVDPGATTRERFRQHTDNATCRSCHQYIDGVGFGFEQFDATGRYRDSEGGTSIDSSGDMNDVEGLGTGTSAAFETLPELGAILAGSDAAAACFVRQARRFSRGYRETAADRCAIDRLDERFRQSGGDLRELIVGIYVSSDFLVRR